MNRRAGFTALMCAVTTSTASVTYMMDLVRSKHPEKLEWYVNLTNQHDQAQSALDYAASSDRESHEMLELLFPLCNPDIRKAGFRPAVKNLNWDNIQWFIDHCESDAEFLQVLNFCYNLCCRDPYIIGCGVSTRREQEACVLSRPVHKRLLQLAEKRGLVIEPKHYDYEFERTRIVRFVQERREAEMQGFFGMAARNGIN